MDINNVKLFHENEHMRDDVHDYIMSAFDAYVVSRVRNGKDVSGAHDAYDIISMAFNMMDDEFKPKKKQGDVNRHI